VGQGLLVVGFFWFGWRLVFEGGLGVFFWFFVFAFSLVLYGWAGSVAGGLVP